QQEKLILAERHQEVKARSQGAGGGFGELKTAMGMLDQAEGEEKDRLRSKVRAVIRQVVNKVIVEIKPGKTRLEKRVGVLVTFKHTTETRVFLFVVPGDGCSIVLKVVEAPGTRQSRVWANRAGG